MHCNRSHSCRNLSYSLLIFAVAFIVGTLAVQMLQTISRLSVWLPSRAILTTDHHDVPIFKNLTFGPCSNNDPISIRRKSILLEGNVDSEPVLYLTNRSDEPLRLSLDQFDNLTDIAAEYDSHYSAGVRERILSRGQTYIFSSEKYDHDPQAISFSYRIRDSKYLHRFAAYFDDSNPTPSGCAFD